MSRDAYVVGSITPGDARGMETRLRLIVSTSTESDPLRRELLQRLETARWVWDRVGDHTSEIAYRKAERALEDYDETKAAHTGGTIPDVGQGGGDDTDFPPAA